MVLINSNLRIPSIIGLLTFFICACSSIEETTFQKINDNYILLLIKALENNIFVGIATHDLRLIEKILHIIEEYNFNKEQFEFQVLYGVPMKETIQKLLSLDYKVRVYVPYGENWYEYSIRRLNENPNISKYVLKNFFTKNFYK